MELQAFIAYILLPVLRCSSFNLDKLNLANSKITSIEHITMNPGRELYMEYYSDYDIPDSEYDYDHIGDIRDLVSHSHFLFIVYSMSMF